MIEKVWTSYNLQVVVSLVTSVTRLHPERLRKDRVMLAHPVGSAATPGRSTELSVPVVLETKPGDTEPGFTLPFFGGVTDPRMVLQR